MCIYTTEDFYECIYGYVECVVLLEQADVRQRFGCLLPLFKTPITVDKHCLSCICRILPDS